jgi:putative flippase GtrA
MMRGVMQSPATRQFLLFAIAGTIGFLVDAAVVTALVQFGGMNPYLGRLLSFLCAVAATFAFNRRFTFPDGARSTLVRQAGQYLLAMSAGFAVNYGSYAWLVYSAEAVRSWPVIGVAVGSVLGMSVNFASSKWWVFRRN